MWYFISDSTCKKANTPSWPAYLKDGTKMVDEGSLFSIWNGTKHSEGYSHTTFLQFVFLATEVQ